MASLTQKMNRRLALDRVMQNIYRVLEDEKQEITFDEIEEFIHNQLKFFRERKIITAYSVERTGNIHFDVKIVP